MTRAWCASVESTSRLSRRTAAKPVPFVAGCPYVRQRGKSDPFLTASSSRLSETPGSTRGILSASRGERRGSRAASEKPQAPSLEDVDPPANPLQTMQTGMCIALSRHLDRPLAQEAVPARRGANHVTRRSGSEPVRAVAFRRGVARVPEPVAKLYAICYNDPP